MSLTALFKVELSFPRKLLAGAVAGGIGAAIANPTDVLKVRMQAAAGVAPYRNTWHGFTTILSTEGTAGLYRVLLLDLCLDLFTLTTFIVGSSGHYSEGLYSICSHVSLVTL